MQAIGSFPRVGRLVPNFNALRGQGRVASAPCSKVGSGVRTTSGQVHRVHYTCAAEFGMFLVNKALLDDAAAGR